MNMALDQWRRVQRYYEIFKEVDSGVELTAGRSGDHCIDAIYAFFQNSHHLKDWIKNDPSIAAGMKTSFLNSAFGTSCLKICADICNGTKHLIRNAPLHSHSVVDFVDREILVRDGGANSGKVSIKVIVEHDGTPLDAMQLATQCVEAWRSILGVT